MVRRTPPKPAEVQEAVQRLGSWLDDDAAPPPARAELADAVRLTARYLAGQHPGGAVELRVPPFVAVQCVAGLNHRRGTPPNVIEVDPRTWLNLATGRLTWAAAVAHGSVAASGSRADLEGVLPIPELSIPSSEGA